MIAKTLLLSTLFYGAHAVTPTVNPTRAPTLSTTTYDRIAAADANKVWLEIGFDYVNDYTWTTRTTKSNSFTNPIVLTGSPVIFGPTYNDGYPSSIRIKNIGVSSGYVTFQMKVFLPNDTYCSSSWYTPTHHDPIQVGWLVGEWGSYVLESRTYMLMYRNINRTTSSLDTNSPSFINQMYPLGCGGSTVRCTFPTSVAIASIGFMSNLQDYSTQINMVYEVFLMVRGQSINRAKIAAVLQPHDSVNTTYLSAKFSTPTVAGYFVYETPFVQTCSEGLSYETTMDTSVTSSLLSHTLLNTYNYPPGVFGQLISLKSTVDSCGIRVHTVDTTTFQMITQEDQCGDEEKEHTTGETASALVAGDSSTTSTTVCFVKYTSALDPTPVPTLKPTGIPSHSPTRSPTVNPTIQPTRLPTTNPTIQPTALPTVSPSRNPTTNPTVNPTLTPTATPTQTPTRAPSSTPTLKPTEAPTGTCSAGTFTVTMTKS